MFKVINDDKNNNVMLYIYELYFLNVFEVIELKIKNIISEIECSENTFSSKNKEYSNTSLLYCCYISYRIFSKNKSTLSEKNFYKIYTYLLLCQLTIGDINDDRNTIILLSIKKNLEFKRVNNFMYFEIKNKDINFNNLKDYILIDEFLEIHNYLNDWIKTKKVNELVVAKWNKNFTKWPLKNNFIIFNLYYTYLTSENDNTSIIKNDLLNLDWSQYFSDNLQYKLFLIAFSAELKNNPKSDTFFKILNSKKSFLAKEFDNAIYRIRDDFLFLIACFFNLEEFEKTILLDYKYIKSILPIDKQKKYLEYRIPYFKKIYEKVKDVIFNYNFNEFDKAVKENDTKNTELNLIPSRSNWRDEVNENNEAIFTNLTQYNLIGTKESIFTSFSIKEKNEYIKNYLLNEMSNENGGLKNLISVIEKDSDKNEIINNFNKIKNQNNDLKIKVDYIQNYFNYLEEKKELEKDLIYLENINFFEEYYNKEKLEKIKNLVLKCFTVDMKKFYFLFIDDSWNSFANKICNFYIQCLNNKRIDIFDSFYLEIQAKMMVNYKQLYEIITYYSKGTWSKEYIFFRLVSLFIDPNILKTESYFDIKFIANYIDNYFFLKKNEWNIAKIINLDNDYTYVIWLIYILYNTQNFYSAYKNFEEIFLKKIEINNIDNYLKCLIEKLNISNIKKPSIGSGITYMYPFDIKITCIFNLLIHYVVNPENEKTLFELIEKDIIDIIINKEFIKEIFYNLFDLYHWINFNDKCKDRITKLLGYIQERIRKDKMKDSSLESITSFSEKELEVLEGKRSKFDYLSDDNTLNIFFYKKIYWIISYHLYQYDDNQKINSKYLDLIELDKSKIYNLGNLIRRYKKFLKKF